MLDSHNLFNEEMRENELKCPKCSRVLENIGWTLLSWSKRKENIGKMSKREKRLDRTIFLLLGVLIGMMIKTIV